MGYIVNFFNSPFFIIIGGVSTLLMIAGVLYAAYLILAGILPVLYRLGMALSKREVAIFASSEYDSLKSMLVDSKIFKNKNIIQVNKNDIKKAHKANLFLVHWSDYKDCMNEILQLKNDSTALVIYAPQSEEKIDDQDMLNKINLQRNSIIVNFRDRLLNDIFISLITANYERK